MRAIQTSSIALAVGLLVASVYGQDPAAVPGEQAPGDETRSPAGQEGSFRFRSGVELINVTVTVSDSTGRFVSGLAMDDFAVHEDDQPVEVTHFSAARVPVSLGIVLDTSGSMAGTKIQEAQTALDRFLYDLLDSHDELFLYRFSDFPVLLQRWTSDRQLLSRALKRLTPNGGTAMYDAVAEAVPLAQEGQHTKRALVLISDGNDTSSRTSASQLKRLIRETEVLVYAIGIDCARPDSSGSCEGQPAFRPAPRQPPRLPVPFPFPPTRGRGGRFPQIFGGGQGGGWRGPIRDRVNSAALRDLTDESGGRTEIVREAVDLNRATSNIADELSKQYYLGYPSSGKKDGRWHTIRVEVRNGRYRVRARRGYLAN